MTIKFTTENDDGEEIEHTLPSVMEVCSECNGHGTHLIAGMKGHAYTSEEFEDSFDEEERHEYFTPGGRYDVTCEECGGKNVVPVVDEKVCENNPELLATLELYYAKAADDAAYERECAAEKRMGA